MRDCNTERPDYSCRELIWKLIRVRGLKYPDDTKLFNALEKEYAQKSLDSLEKLVNKELKAAWEAKGSRCHGGRCRAYFFEYGKFSYDYSDPEENARFKGCLVCGDPLECAGQTRHHDYKGLSQEKCRERGILHFGRCYHVSECVRCGHIHAVDSSD